MPPDLQLGFANGKHAASCIYLPIALSHKSGSNCALDLTHLLYIWHYQRNILTTQPHFVFLRDFLLLSFFLAVVCFASAFLADRMFRDKQTDPPYGPGWGYFGDCIWKLEGRVPACTREAPSQHRACHCDSVKSGMFCKSIAIIYQLGDCCGLCCRWQKSGCSTTQSQKGSAGERLKSALHKEVAVQ